MSNVQIIEAKTVHVRTCPRYGLLCECSACHPPICLCDLVRACAGDNAETVRRAFYDAVGRA